MLPGEPKRLLHPAWTLLLPIVALTILIFCPPERRMLSTLLSASLFALMQWAFPKCRFRTEHYFCPVNVALSLLLLKLVIVPALMMMTGAESRVLRTLPSLDSMEGALRIDTLAYVAFCLGLAWAPQGRLEPASSSLAAALSRTPNVAFIWIFVGLGVVGFIAAFGSLSRIILYFSDPAEMAAIQQETEGTLQGLMATLLRPFLAFSLVAWWSRVADENTSGRATWKPTIVGFIAAIGITLANLTFSFNRAAFMFPLICLAAVYSARIRRIPFSLSAATMALLLPVLISLATYRSGAENAGSPTEFNLTSALSEASENFQAYSGGPQFTGIFYDRVGWGDHLYGGSTVVASIMSPVPVLGKGFRETSGPALFNYALYGVSGIEDQIIPFATELFANFHAPGVVAGLVMLGLFLSQAERWFDAAQSNFSAFAIQYASLWGAMLSVWSISIYSQILIYFFFPIYFYIAVLRLRLWLNSFRGSVAQPGFGAAQ